MLTTCNEMAHHHWNPKLIIRVSYKILFANGIYKMKHTNNKLASGKGWHKANLFFISNIHDKLIRK